MSRPRLSASASRSRARSRAPVTPLASVVARAAADTHGVDMHNVVTALARTAAASIVTRGLVASDEWRSVVDAIATQHLKRAEADRQLTRALRKVNDHNLRSAIEVAHAEVLDLGELAHYYAGLMSGLMLLEVSQKT